VTFLFKVWSISIKAAAMSLNRWTAVFLVFRFVSAQSQGFFKPAPSPKPRENPKIPAAHHYIFSFNAPVLLS
jgi:hypothetical protein